MKRSRFAFYAWVTLVVTLGVILWGDVVQATGSGDGCGAHWPTCNGDLVPLARSGRTRLGSPRSPGIACWSGWPRTARRTDRSRPLPSPV
ncbi:MAG: COX15/CtaA family protein, partial [Deinococcus sp.]|nr:COX15/CtaA family protein [Deinococcus sp.]